MTVVDECETHPAMVMRVNAEMARGVALAARDSGARLAFVSTDSVFNGLSSFYDVTDAPSPVNVYARTKRAGELETTAILPGALVVRTNMYGWNAQRKLSLAEFMLGHLRSGRPFTGFDDVIFSPLLVNHLGAVLLELMTADARGVLHVAARDAVTKFEFGLRLAGLYGLDASLIQRGSSREAQLPATRPRNTSLNVSSVRRWLSHEMPSIDEGLRAFKELEGANWPERLKSCMKG
jgi:dTDP-4-dehydrorhamnose reductase